VTQPQVPPIDFAHMIGGRRGVIDTTSPGIALVMVDVFAPLTWAIVAAVIVAIGIAVLRLRRRQPVQQAIMGVPGIVVCALLAAFTGDAKTYFLPGILLNATWALVLTISVIVRRPLLGYAAALLDRGYTGWLNHPGLRRAATIATCVWIALFTIRASVQGYLYAHDDVNLLAPVRLGMGLPLFFLAIAGTLYLLEAEREEEEEEGILPSLDVQPSGSGGEPAAS
jgi:hypothetical protein